MWKNLNAANVFAMSCNCLEQLPIIVHLFVLVTFIFLIIFYMYIYFFLSQFLSVKIIYCKIVIGNFDLYMHRVHLSFAFMFSYDIK